MLTPPEAQDLWPLMDDVRCGRGGVSADRRAGQPVRHDAVSGQGRVGAGVRIFEDTGFTSVLTDKGRVSGCGDERSGGTPCEMVVNCAGQWAREVDAEWPA